MSFIADFYKRVEKKYDEFFSKKTVDSSIDDAYKKVKALRKQLDEAENEYTVKLNMGYSENFTPVSKQIILQYTGRNDTLCFDGLTGTAVDLKEDNETVVYRLDGRSGTTSFVVGYCLPLAAIIKREYKYNIPSNNQKITLQMLNECLIPMINDGFKYWEYYPESLTSIEKEYYSLYAADNAIGNYNATEFINLMYGKSNSYDITLCGLYRALRDNKSFELMLDENKDVFNYLYRKQIAEAKPPYKLYDITPEVYEKLKSSGRLLQFFKLIDYIKTLKPEDIYITKTNMAWADYIIESKDWQETIEFYGTKMREDDISMELFISYHGRTDSYYYRSDSNPIFSKYYKFGKFCKYFIDGVIDQGYKSTIAFAQTLKDYIEMCERYGSRPTLTTPDLEKAHNIISRNHSIAISPEQTALFNEKYKDFKQSIIGDYAVICPSNPYDLIKEGDALNHCCAFYTHKVINDECKVLFLRLKDKLDESLITLEIKENKITQAEGFLRREPTENELKAITSYAKDNSFEMAI